MQEFAVILISAIFVNNIILVQCIGLCPFVGSSNKIEIAISVAGSTTIVLITSAILSFLINRWILIPLNIEYFKAIFFIFVIVVIVLLIKMYVEKNKPLLHRSIGTFLPLIATNSAVLGVALQNSTEEHTLLETFLYSFGISIGFSLVLISFSAMRERITSADVPKPFIGSSITLITAGLMSLAFMGFIGLI
jgi:electron transport complex protein RnfA